MDPAEVGKCAQSVELPRERRRWRWTLSQPRIPDIVWNAIVLRAGPRSTGVLYAHVVPLPSHRITRSYYRNVRPALRIRELELVIEADVHKVVSRTCRKRESEHTNSQPPPPMTAFEPY